MLNAETLLPSSSIPVNGSAEDLCARQAFGALNRFYRAFNARNLALMRSSWAESEAICMCNPLGDVLRGWEPISALYRKIFLGEARVWVEFHDYSVHESGDMLLFCGRERGTVTTAAGSLALAIRTTRVFVKQDAEWRLLHHHGSIPKPELLSAYLSLINPTPTP